MKRLFVRLLVAATFAAALAPFGRTIRANQPQYAIQPQNAAQPQYCEHPHYLFLAPTNHGSGQFVPAQAYAYGWFGVALKPHAVFHWDYYDHRWIWW